MLVGTLFLAACSTESTSTWQAEGDYAWREVDVRNGREGFESVASSSSGIGFSNTLEVESFLRNRHYVNGSGVAAGDIDSDGWVDLYFAGLDAESRLYVNLGDWRFEDVTENAGLSDPARYTVGATFADIDADGDLDLLTTSTDGPNLAYLNDGLGHFLEASDELGLLPSAGSTTMALADLEGDGDLDLYVGNYKAQTVKDILPPWERSFDQVVRQIGDDYEVAEGFRDHYRLNIQGNRLMRFEYAEPDYLYRNTGVAFSLVEQTDWRVDEIEAGAPSAAERAGTPNGAVVVGQTGSDAEWALTVRLQDFDGDMRPDLYVANDFESPDTFLLNRSPDTTAISLESAPALSLRKTSHSTMAIDLADVDRDGDVDFFLPDMLAADYRQRHAQMGQRAPVLSFVGDINNRPQEVQNTLHLNRGDATFQEVAFQFGVAASDWSWSSIFLDVDLDGYEDLLITNGHHYDAMHADTQVRMGNAPAGPNWRESLLEFPPLPLSNVAFRNVSGRRFEAMADGWGIGSEEDVSHGMALADLDNDGDLDVVINRLNAPAGVFRNTSGRSRLAVRLRGSGGNTQGIGSKVRVYGGPVEMQEKEIIAGGQYLSGSEALAVFAAGEADSLTIEVLWRSGGRSVVTGARPNRIYEMDESGKTDYPSPYPEQRKTENGKRKTETRHPTPDTRRPLAHTHHEEVFDDFARQLLMSRKLSQLGPYLAAGDADGDGDADVLVGSGKGGRLALLTNRDGELSARSIGEVAEGDQTGVAIVVPVPPAAGSTKALVAISNYEMPPVERQTPNSWIEVYDLPGGRLVQTLDFGPDSPGSLALSDIDSDGDEDLFAAGRVRPGAYPIPASSRVYLNEGGTFAYSAELSSPFESVGLVTDAAFGDMDSDGDDDLVLSTEWGSVRLFANEGNGRFADATADWGLDARTGWWQSVGLGDFNSDGRTDIVATNWGWNTRYGQPEREGHPLRLYYGDFDGNGVFDLVESRWDTRREMWIPEEGLPRFSAGLPFVRSRIPSFEVYARSSVGDVIGPSLASGKLVEANTLGHMIFVNLGRRFEARSLPDETQLTPSLDVVVLDEDRDDHLDLFLSQNFFAVAPETARSDAGLGLWLRGDGEAGFTPVAAAESGVRIYGEQRGAVAPDLDQDGRPDLVVGQNGAAAVVFLSAPNRQ